MKNYSTDSIPLAYNAGPSCTPLVHAALSAKYSLKIHQHLFQSANNIQTWALASNLTTGSQLSPPLPIRPMGKCYPTIPFPLQFKALKVKSLTIIIHLAMLLQSCQLQALHLTVLFPHLWEQADHSISLWMSYSGIQCLLGDQIHFKSYNRATNLPHFLSWWHTRNGSTTPASWDGDTWKQGRNWIARIWWK